MYYISKFVFAALVLVGQKFRRRGRSHFSDSTPVPKFLNLGLEIFKFENPTLVQTPATIDPTLKLTMFLLTKLPHRPEVSR